jgi:hypothetical protein
VRDVLTIPFHGEGALIIASDNSGAIGSKAGDLVQVPYETVAYYSFRVAVMECIAAGGEPFSVVLHNFCGNETWAMLTGGIQKGLVELHLQDVPITGSTESNFSMQQSAVGLLVIGKKSILKRTEFDYCDSWKFAVVGTPLIGNEVVEQEERIVPLLLFREVSKLQDVIVWPVGSKGILYEMNQMFRNKSFSKEMVVTSVDVGKSSGPATCFIAAYPENQEAEIKKLTKGFFHSVQILT